MSSITFYKYCGNGFGEERPLEVGQKQAIVKVLQLFPLNNFYSHQYFHQGYGEKCTRL